MFFDIVGKNILLKLISPVMFLMRLLNFLIVCMWPIFLLYRAEVDDFPVI